MKKLIPYFSALFVFIACFGSPLIAQTENLDTKAPARFFVAPTNDGFGNFLSAALLENRLPLVVTADESAADFVVVANNAKGQNKWYDTVFGVEKDRNQGSMKVIRVADKVVVWASASGDKSFWFAEFKNMGQSKVANRLARKLKSDLPQILATSEGIIRQNVRVGQASEILKKELSVNSSLATSDVTADVHNLVGLEQFQKANYSGAEVSFRLATLREPGNASYHYNLGTALMALGSMAEAEKEIALANRLAPTEPLYSKGLETIRSHRKTSPR